MRALICIPCLLTGETEIHSHRKNGILVSPFDLNLYAKELSRMMTDTETLKEMANNAYTDVKKFSVQNIADQWEKLFNEL